MSASLLLLWLLLLTNLVSFSLKLHDLLNNLSVRGRVHCMTCHLLNESVRSDGQTEWIFEFARVLPLHNRVPWIALSKEIGLIKSTGLLHHVIDALEERFVKISINSISDVPKFVQTSIERAQDVSTILIFRRITALLCTDRMHQGLVQILIFRD